MSTIEPQFKGNLGLFLVCAELSKQNLIAMPTSRNTKGYDIVVLNPETGAATGIQVKCTDRKDFPVFSSYWKDYEEKIEEKVMSDFVFVDISESDKPNYFIVSDGDLKNLLKSTIKNYWHKFSERHNGLTWEQCLEYEKTKKPQLWSLKLNDIDKEEYRGKWETITNRLQNPRR